MQCPPPGSLVQASHQGCSFRAVAWPPAEYQPRAPGTEPTLTASAVLADCRLHICLYYREVLVKELTTSSPEGCRISHGHTYDASSLDQVLFPYPEDNSQRKNIEKLLSHLERGVVLWMAPDGLYAKRLCQSRIYWDGPLALCSDRPNKLERDQTCKLFDTQQFLSGEVERLGRNGVPVRAGPGSVELLMVGVSPRGSWQQVAQQGFLLCGPAPTRPDPGVGLLLVHLSPHLRGPGKSGRLSRGCGSG